ncbi:hypothetical protein M3J09_012685 [Ascochyta lentis]
MPFFRSNQLFSLVLDHPHSLSTQVHPTRHALLTNHLHAYTHPSSR